MCIGGDEIHVATEDLFQLRGDFRIEEEIRFFEGNYQINVTVRASLIAGKAAEEPDAIYSKFTFVT